MKAMEIFSFSARFPVNGWVRKRIGAYPLRGFFVFGKRAMDFAENQSPDELIFKDHDSDLLVRM